MEKMSLLDRIRSARLSEWLDAVQGRPHTPIEDLLAPSRAFLEKQPDEELAQLVAATPNSREGQLAASILRVREAWKSPEKWSFIVSVAALVVSGIALVRTYWN